MGIAGSYTLGAYNNNQINILKEKYSDLKSEVSSISSDINHISRNQEKILKAQEEINKNILHYLQESKKGSRP